jgi:hypothetical protein
MNTHLSHGDYIGQCVANRSVQTELQPEQRFGLNFRVYPNPGYNNFTLYMNSDSKYQNVEIINMSGQIIKQIQLKGQDKINFAINNAGVYFIRLINGKNILTQKLVVLK